LKRVTDREVRAPPTFLLILLTNMTSRATMEMLLEEKKEILQNMLEEIRVLEVKLASTAKNCECYCNCSLLEWDNRTKTHHDEKCGMTSCIGATCVRKEQDVPTFCDSECCTTKNCGCSCIACEDDDCVCECHVHCTECHETTCVCYGADEEDNCSDEE